MGLLRNASRVGCAWAKDNMLKNVDEFLSSMENDGLQQVFEAMEVSGRHRIF